MEKRGSGILLHISSLSSPYGIGDLGPQAFKFVDFLAETRQSYWQILPLNPTDPAYGSSPYHSISTFAHNPLFISPQALLEQGLLDKADLDCLPRYQEGKVDYQAVAADKKKLLFSAYQRFKKTKDDAGYKSFCSGNSSWLEDYALFTALKQHFSGQEWSCWPDDIRDRRPRALQSLRRKLNDRIEREKFIQYLFFRQWAALKRYANQKGIKIMGDLPIYVVYDSADVWSNPEIFKLDKQKRLYVVAGVPPDYFSKTGQLWGNPLYRWDVLKEMKYEWWVRRVEHSLKFADILRIDHFRGLVAYWEIPAAEKTAIRGKWVKAEAVDFLNTLTARFSPSFFLAEDLGIITDDVREVMQRFGFAGMKVLLFAFGEDNPKHPYLPHNYEKNCVVYTGTHDNNTCRGWFEKEAAAEEKKRLFAYLKREVNVDEISWELIRLTMNSVADTVIFPLQDVLGLGQEARMNIPGTSQGNWQWRLLSGQLTQNLAERLLEITKTHKRAQ
jgi:4-alpha-glucanotransferase